MRMSEFDHEENKGLHLAFAFIRLALRILLIVLVIIGIIYFSRKFYSLGYETFSAKPLAESEEEGRDVTVVITKSMSLKDIGKLLNDAGLIDESEEAFEIQARVYGFADSMIPGPYVLNTSMTVEEMMEFMSTPKEETEEK